MKKMLLIAAIGITLGSCGNSSGNTETNPSDTTNLHINPALEDPNSNMADTMNIPDSSRVKDTSVRDHTDVKQ